MRACTASCLGSLPGDYETPRVARVPSKPLALANTCIVAFVVMFYLVYMFNSQKYLALESPDGTREQGRGDRVVGWIVEQPGLHRVFDKASAERAAYAVRFHDPSESDLRGLVSRESLPAPNDEGPDGSLRDTSVERRWLGFLLLVLALADWWFLARRGA